MSRGERCLYVVGQDTPDEFREGLRQAGIGVNGEEAGGALILITKHEGHLNGGYFEPGKMITMLHGAVKDAPGSVFTTARTCRRRRSITTSPRIRKRKSGADAAIMRATDDFFCALPSKRSGGPSMKLDIYLNYPGNCEQAFRFYEQHLGGRITMLSRHAEAPQSAVPSDWKNKVLHARIEIGHSVLMGADIPSAEPMRSTYITLTLDTAAEAERLYALLSDGGQIFMKMEQTFFAKRFAMLRDRFGTSWMLLNET